MGCLEIMLIARTEFWLIVHNKLHILRYEKVVHMVTGIDKSVSGGKKRDAYGLGENLKFTARERQGVQARLPPEKTLMP